MKHILIFDELAELFSQHNYRLYMIGGTTRDYLLNNDISDYDFVSDATPDEIRCFLPEADYSFAQYGSIHFLIRGERVDITTLRIEGEYLDYRHPSFIKYVKDISLDYIRRDFSINAIYIDKYYKIHDFCDGIKDLQDGIIRFIGDPDKRVKEDPLRILRAERFAKKYNFVIEENSLLAIKTNYSLLEQLSKDKIKEELAK